MSLTECLINELVEKSQGELNITQPLPSSEYLDSAKTYTIAACTSDNPEKTENLVWSLANPQSKSFCEVHEKAASMNSPKITLTPSEDTRSCSVTIDPANPFRTSASIMVYVWNTDSPENFRASGMYVIKK